MTAIDAAAAIRRQTTIGRTVHISGPGLHTGRSCSLAIAPAPAGYGIRWQRMDLPHKPIIPATISYVVNTDRATTIGVDGARVQTIEHVMAALAGLGIDNALVHVDGPEPPFADGAAGCFVRHIQEAGVVAQDAPRMTRTLPTPVAVSAGDAHIIALPATTFRISYTFVSDSPALGTQFAEHDIVPEQFARDVAPARTVGWLAEVEALQRRGLALGVTPDAAVVVDGNKLLGPMKFPNEVARHKVLDIVGDLALAGPFTAHVIALRSGHALHVQLARKLGAVLVAPAVASTEEEFNRK